MLANENELLHTVTILLIPVAPQAGLLLHQFSEFFLGHSGVPLAGITQTNLSARLFEDIADIRFVPEPADTLGTNYAVRPFTGNKLVEES